MENYGKIKEIGKGSYGVVWLVNHKKDKKNYVLKQIDLRKTSDKDIRSAEQEAKLLSNLKHPNIVSYKESFQSKGFLYIVMLYCEGGDLYTQIKKQENKHLEETQVVEWFVQIAMALQYMHERHILHRDLKTQNIFLTKNKIVKVGDLGIARVLNDNNDMATTIIGTPSDVWALGCCVYEMATLKHAFNAKDINALVFKILKGKMPPMPSVYSKDLIVLIESMLNADPKKRPSVNKILRDPYIRQNINSFLERTKARQASSNRQEESPKIANNSQNENKIEIRKNPRPNIIQSAPPVKDIFDNNSNNNNRKSSDSRNYDSKLYSNNENEREESNFSNRRREQNQRPLSSAHIKKEKNLLNSDSDGDNRPSSRQSKEIAQSPISSNGIHEQIDKRMYSDNSPQRNSHHKSSIDSPNKQRRSVRISSIVSDIENNEHIGLNDCSSPSSAHRNDDNLKNDFYKAKSAINSSHSGSENSNYHGLSQASSSIDSNENKDRDYYESKLSNNRPIVKSSSSVESAPSTDQSIKANLSARERRRQRIRLSQNDDIIDTKPPVLKKVEKIVHKSEIDSKPKPIVSKSFGAHVDTKNDNFKDFPFQDSLKLIKQTPIGVSKSEDLSKKNAPHHIRPQYNLPLPVKINKIPVKQPQPFCESNSSSSSELDLNLEPEKAEMKQKEKDKKEVDSFINALNTTLNSLCINKADSEIDEFEEVELIEEHDENQNVEDKLTTNSNEETLKPISNGKMYQEGEDDNYISIANMTLGTLSTTKKILDRISILENDCIQGIGKQAFQSAYDILEKFRDEEMEPKLLSLLGRRNYDNYVGKIWQLKFYIDSEKKYKKV